MDDMGWTTAPGVTPDSTALQREREQAMKDRGAHRARAGFAKALDRGEAAETPGGVHLAKRAIGPLADAIRAFCGPKQGAGRRHTAAALLRGVDAELAAYLTLRAVLGYANSNRSLQSAAVYVADMLEAELIADSFEAANTALFRAVVRNAKNRGLGQNRQANAVKLANRKFSVVERPWTQKQRVHLGTKLIELAIETTGIIETKLQRTGRRQQLHLLSFTPEIHEWLRKYNDAAALTRPFMLPTVVPPAPWTSTFGGAYYGVMKSRSRLLTRPFKGQMEALEAADLSRVYKGLNGLQATPWRINRRVLAVMQEAWENNAQGLPIPPRESEPRPVAPQEVIDDVKGGEHRRAWRRRLRDWHQRDQKERAGRFEFHRCLDIAQENAEQPAIYFPHRLDFRGRCYSAATTLHPQGPDEARALLEFAEGKPLGERGVWWLGVHGANLWGNDKVSLDERYQWAWEHAIHATEVANDPLSNRWWTEADKPWSFLAWCLEWAEAMRVGRDYVSHMPIALDGTCNGLQHYSAMLRDEVGGRAVNLVPGDKPNDVYADVAAVATERLRALADKALGNSVSGPDAEDGFHAEALLNVGIDRKVTKRPVMVLPYGGTYKSCHEYASQAMREKLAGENVFGDQDHKAMHLLAKVIWESIGKVVVKAREGMSWLQSVARASAKAERPLQWTAPSGFVVIQDYRDLSEHRIETRFCGSIITFRSGEPAGIDGARQASAVAPNFVHSLDASALVLTIGRCLDEGIASFAMIHDSYGTHAADTDRMASLLREEFVRVYQEHDVLQEFHDANTAEGVEPPPAKGSLDLTQVLASEYFFA
jgi:DNA-directed RNA polymerase